MVSTEVQRTLVKSPPELWTELSDPVSLGRHLDEFGEIRITRVEPETTVEWEADDVSGAVEIKPSGWGTRVTLSVRRQVAAPHAPEPPGPPEPAQDAGDHDGPAATIAQDPPSTGQEAADAQPRAAEEADAAQTDEASLRQEEQLPDREDDEGLESEAERYVAGEAQWEADEWDCESPDEPAREDDTEHAPERRRGFLARVFGWRRRTTPGRMAAGDVDLGGASEQYALADDGGETEEWPSASLGTEPPAPVTAAAAAAAAAADHAVADSIGETSMARLGSPSAAPVAEGQHHAGAAELAPPDPARASSEAEQTAAEAELPAGQVDQPAAENDQPAAEAEQPDLSAELAAAETVAAEEVTAVLTSMLDRLGTAHHRPFSRA